MNPSSPTVSSEEMVALTSRITAAYLRGNALPVADIAGVIAIVHEFAPPARSTAPPPQQEETRKPAVPIRRSVTAEYIVCLEDGRKLKMLKRHLSATYGMTPDQYRARWNLPADYPMVAPAYAERRSDLARASGLGRRRPEPEPVHCTEKARPSQGDGLIVRAPAPRTVDDRDIAVVSGAGR